MNKLFAILIVVVLSFSMTACDEILNQIENNEAEVTPTTEIVEEVTENSQETVETTVEAEQIPKSEIKEVVILPTGTKVYAYGAGSGEILFDLDCDGTMEDIDFLFDGQEDVDISFDDDNYYIFTGGDSEWPTSNICLLSINGDFYTKTMSEYDYEFDCTILIVDIDPDDNRYEIVLTDYGPSSDFYTYILAYENNEIIEVGEIGGLPVYDQKILSNGYITTQSRGSILHTWFYQSNWHYEDGKLVEIYDNDDGYILMNTPVVVKEEIYLQVSPTDPNTAYVLMPDDMATITYTDDVRWVCLQDAQGNEGWYDLGEEYFYGGDLFDGLCFAD